MDGLRRLREPAAICVLALLLLQVLIEWVQYVVDGSVLSPMPETLTILVLGLLVASCVLGQQTAHARMLTVLAVIGSALSILTSVALAIIAPATESQLPFMAWLDLILDLVLPVLVILGLAKLRSRQPAAEHPPMPSTTVADAGPIAPALPSTQLEPVWQPDSASGVAWHTAGDAALGAPASGWGTPGESSGWNPTPDEDDSASGDRSRGES